MSNTQQPLVPAAIAPAGPDLASKATLTILNERSSVAGVLAAGGLESQVLATSNWHVEQRLKREGLQVIQIENLLSHEQSVAIDAFAFGLLQNWYLHAGRDFTQVAGQSLGRIAEYELLHGQTYPTEALTAVRGLCPYAKGIGQFVCLLDRIRPSLIRHDLHESSALDALRTVAGQRGIALERLDPPAGADSGDPRREQPRGRRLRRGRFPR